MFAFPHRTKRNSIIPLIEALVAIAQAEVRFTHHSNILERKGKLMRCICLLDDGCYFEERAMAPLMRKISVLEKIIHIVN